MHEKIVSDIVNLINEEVSNGKTIDFVKYKISLLLENAAIGISSVEYFDEKYFKKSVGKRISSYAKDVQLELAFKEYAKKNDVKIRQKKKEMNFVVLERYQFGELEWTSHRDMDAGLILIEATSCLESVKKYLLKQFYFENEKFLKKVLFQNFFENIEEIVESEFDFENLEDEDCFYIQNIFRTFDKYEEILKLAVEVRNKYIKDLNSNPVDVYERIYFEVEEMEEMYWNLMTQNDRKYAYLCARKYEVECWPVTRLSRWNKILKHNSENLIVHGEKNDYSIWNTICKLIKSEVKEDYSLDKSVFENLGYAEDVSSTLMAYCLSGKLNRTISLDFNNGDWLVGALADISVEYAKNVVHIKPLEHLWKLARANYNFFDKKNDVAKEALKINHNTSSDNI